MSQPKRRREFVWSDAQGRETREKLRLSVRGQSLASLTGRLVDAHCPAGHLTAVLLANGDDAPPVLYLHHPNGPHPAFVLVPDGLDPAIRDGDKIGVFGAPVAHADVTCPRCGAVSVLDAAVLTTAVAAVVPGKTRRIRLVQS